MSDDPTDAALLAATARGDDAAFDRFVERHRAAVFRYARAHAGPTDAEDVLQQTFVAAWRSAATAEVRRGARPWLLTIARNDILRRRRRAVDTREHTDSIEDLGCAAGFAAPDATPERFATATEEHEILTAAMNTLTDQEREIVHLRDIEELSGDDVARMLGLSLAAMKSRLHRARLRLVAEVRRRLPEENRR